jgi:hypothetical protein
MIHSLKSMLLNKNIKKKEKASQLGENTEQHGKLKEVMDENGALRK